MIRQVGAARHETIQARRHIHPLQPVGAIDLWYDSERHWRDKFVPGPLVAAVMNVAAMRTLPDRNYRPH